MSRKPEPVPQAHFVLGEAYQAGGIWYYPQESYSAVQTGIASIEPDDHAPLTADGERFDQNALAAAHQTLQLPAIARITDLESGRQITVRINDRGPASPSRVVAVTRRAAELLAFPPTGVARTRLEVLEPESHAVADPLRGSAGPRLAIAAAPRGEVQAAALAPPLGASGESGIVATTSASGADATARALPEVPAHLPEIVTQTTPDPGSLYIDLGSFSRRQFAEQRRASLAGLSPEIEQVRTGRTQSYRVRIGPLATVAEADAALAAAIGSGVSDARIVVE